METTPKEVTHLLQAWRGGDEAAFDQLLPLVYDELRRLAGRYMRRERADHTLQASALVHEAYLRLAEQDEVEWQNRTHFFALAAQAMRRVLVDHARSRNYQKRGGQLQHVELEEAAMVAEERAAEVVALDEALQSLAEIDARKARVVELRYFGGLTMEETAEVLGVSVPTVMRDWTSAKLWLRRAMSAPQTEDEA